MGFDRWRYVVPLRLRSLFRSNRVDRELDEELQYHIERQIELNVERGMELVKNAVNGSSGFDGRPEK